jgi:hypothetical protein
MEFGSANLFEPLVQCASDRAHALTFWQRWYPGQSR